MPACWSCGVEAGPDAFCASCGRIQPAREKDAFALFGVEPRFHVDRPALEARFREHSKKLHPDRFAKADARERRFSLEQTTLLNKAWKTLKDDTLRAEQLLRMHGLKVASDEAGTPGAGGRLPLSFYEQVMDDREALEEAKATSPEAVQALAAKVMARRDASLGLVDAAFIAWESSGDVAALTPAETELAKLRYEARFLDEVEGRSHD
jgi:molecular chaperone HscB